MSDTTTIVPARAKLSRLAARSPLVAFAFAFIVLTLVVAFVVAPLASDYATKINMAMRAQPPFRVENGWLYLLGSDNLGRSLLARVALGAQTTFKLAISAVALSFVIGVALGVWAGYRLGWQSAVIMRMADSIMSFPVLLLAMLLLYIFQAQNNTLIFVLAFSRIPLFLRVARSEVLEVRERQFVLAAKAMGVGTFWILRMHIIRSILPTLMIIASMEIAFVMLSESSLSFIGLGVRSPDISWGLMVSQGAQYLSTAWWLAIVPGTAIVITALSLNLLASWMQLYIDPQQRWRIGA